MTEQEKRYRDLSSSANSTFPPGKNYLLVIGIDKYEHCPPLYNAVRDAQNFADVLTQKYQFNPEYIVKVFDEEATRSNILRRFREISRRIESNDSLVIYYSGHGLFDEHFDHGYWVPVNAKLDPDDISDYIGNDDLIRFIKATKSKHTFLIVDSCFSGTLFARIRLAGISRLETKSSRWALTSGRKEPVLDGQPGMSSPFSQYLLSYLRENTQKKLLVSELVQYVKSSVANNAEQIPIGYPLQNVGDEGGEFAFHLKVDEVEAWAVCKNENSIAGYQSFLQEFPQGHFRQEAQQNLAFLEEELAWENARKENSIPAYFQYDQSYPNGRYTQQAMNAIKELEETQAWEKARHQDTIYAYRNFTRKYPESKHVKKAMDRINTLLTQQSKDGDQHKEESGKKEPIIKAADHQNKPSKVMTDPSAAAARSSRRLITKMALATIALMLLVLWIGHDMGYRTGILKTSPPTLNRPDFNGDELLVTWSNGAPPFRVKLFNDKGQVKYIRRVRFKRNHTIILTKFRKTHGDHILQILDARGRKNNQKIIIDPPKK